MWTLHKTFWKRHSRELIRLRLTDWRGGENAKRQSKRKQARETAQREVRGRQQREGEKKRGLFFCSIYRVMAVFPARSLVSSPMTGCHIISSLSQHLNCPTPQFSPSSLASHLHFHAIRSTGYVSSPHNRREIIKALSCFGLNYSTEININITRRKTNNCLLLTILVWIHCW